MLIKKLFCVVFFLILFSVPAYSVAESNVEISAESAVVINADTGEIKHPLGTGDVGIDIGTSTVAVSGQSDVKILELADKVQDIENQKQKLLRKMDRSRRATNPCNYNEDGTFNSQGNK